MSDVIDMAVVEELLELCEAGDPELLVDLIEMFLADSPARVHALLEALDAGDLENVERAAHSLKGSAGNLGAHHLQQVSEALQQASRKADHGAARALADELRTRYAEAETALRALRAQFS